MSKRRKATREAGRRPPVALVLVARVGSGVPVPPGTGTGDCRACGKPVWVCVAEKRLPRMARPAR